jgi:NADPH2:quinone reductase
MKAVLCKEWGPPESLVLEDIPAREPGPGQVRIRVRAASVNFPDVLIIQNKYQFKPERPFSPGSEAAGDVISVGEGVTHVKAGDRVLASTGHGSFAEEVIASAEKVVLLPPGL